MVTLHVSRTQTVSAVFCPFFHHLPSDTDKHHCELRVAYTRNMNGFNNKPVSVVHINVLFFNILSKFIYTLIGTRRSDRMRDLTAAIAASVVETTHRPGLLHQQHFLVHEQTSYTKHNNAGLLKHLSPHYWTHLRVNGI